MCDLPAVKTAWTISAAPGPQSAITAMPPFPGGVVRQAWVRIEEGEDRRTRIVALTAAGEQALMRALPLWKQAHAHMLHGLGEQQVDTLRADLAAVVALSQ